jgi:hypothetical protein
MADSVEKVLFDQRAKIFRTADAVRARRREGPHRYAQNRPRFFAATLQWQTLENHTVDFRGSENFAEWRALVGQYFAAPPDVEHTQTVLTT